MLVAYGWIRGLLVRSDLNDPQGSVFLSSRFAETVETNISNKNSYFKIVCVLPPFFSVKLNPKQ